MTRFHGGSRVSDPAGTGFAPRDVPIVIARILLGAMSQSGKELVGLDRSERAGVAVFQRIGLDDRLREKRIPS